MLGRRCLSVSFLARKRPPFHRTCPSLQSFFSTTPLLDKVLIANRGEIACRIIRTCRRLGIPTVSLYSNADGPNALHAQMADESYEIGTGPTPTESYLKSQDILDIANVSNATAIHPGYGFLSENAHFCQMVQNHNNLTWIGPTAAAIQAMGSKSESKAIMEAAGVPTTPGYYNTKQQDSPQLLKERALEIGFPVLIKAVMGGGGKGMRLVWNESEFLDALEACQGESQAAFGDDRVLLEKYLVNPRHVEVQIMADKHGNVVHLYERDCSLQRRHQKVIEEAPASDLNAKLRHKLGEMGKRAAQAVDYVNAGTVEFLLEKDEFYFCEMNTRLQVEHPVTEMITGIDLVEWQLRVAAGEPLPLTQEEISCMGHAMEARIYAENPARQFLPATGQLWHYQPPPNARVDTGLEKGQDVSVYYDPMISKLIVHDKDRESCRKRFVQALQEYQIAGVPTNIDFLVKCAEHPVFCESGAMNTGFLQDFADDVHIPETTPANPIAQTVGAFAALLYLENRIGRDTTLVGPWSSRSGSWRMGGELGRARKTLRLQDNDKELVCVCNRDGSFDIIVPDKAQKEQCIHITGSLTENGEMQVVLDGTRRIHLTCALKLDNDGIIRVRMWPQNQPDDYAWELDVQHPMLRKRSDAMAASGGDGGGMVKSPMPGRIRRILCKEGDNVKAGQVVMVMEAMKMEHSIQAPRDGTLTEIRFKVDDVVQDGAVLLVVDGGDDENNNPSGNDTSTDSSIA